MPMPYHLDLVEVVDSTLENLVRWDLVELVEPMVILVIKPEVETPVAEVVEAADLVDLQVLNKLMVVLELLNLGCPLLSVVAAISVLAVEQVAIKMELVVLETQVVRVDNLDLLVAIPVELLLLVRDLVVLAEMVVVILSMVVMEIWELLLFDMKHNQCLPQLNN